MGVLVGMGVLGKCFSCTLRRIFRVLKPGRPLPPSHSLLSEPLSLFLTIHALSSLCESDIVLGSFGQKLLSLMVERG